MNRRPLLRFFINVVKAPFQMLPGFRPVADAKFGYFEAVIMQWAGEAVMYSGFKRAAAKDYENANRAMLILRVGNGDDRDGVHTLIPVPTDRMLRLGESVEISLPEKRPVQPYKF